MAQQKKVPTLVLIGAEIPEGQVVTLAVIGTLSDVKLISITKARFINLTPDQLAVTASSDGVIINRLYNVLFKFRRKRNFNS